MSEMVERVAKAIGLADIRCIDTIEGYRRILAKSAIKAMREPTEEMFNECSSLSFEQSYLVKEFYRAMIDAALKDNNNESVAVTDNENQDSKSNV